MGCRGGLLLTAAELMFQKHFVAASPLDCDMIHTKSLCKARPFTRSDPAYFTSFEPDTSTLRLITIRP